MTSLRRRLLVGTGVGTVIVLVMAGTSLYAMMRASLLREFDKALRERAVTLSALIEQKEEEILLEFTEAEMLEFQRTQRPEYFQVWRGDGTVVDKSPLLGTANLPQEELQTDDPVICPLELPGKVRGRMVTAKFTPRLDDESSPPSRRERLTLAFARDLADVEYSLGQLRNLLTVVGVAATLASMNILVWQIRVGLKPVDQLAARISVIDERGLAARIDPRESPRELSGIVGGLNEFLGRLDAAFHREKTMTANVAHELRTPLAGIRSTLEVALSRERDAEASRQVMSECLQICTQTQRLVETLLAMARIEAGKETTHAARTEIGALLQKAWRPYAELARERKLKVEWELDNAPSIDTDAEKLQVVFANILENAAEYVDTGGTITIFAGRSNGVLRIRVTNTGRRLTNDDVPRVFDPFWRGDASRAATGTHSGLGLALCKSVVERLGGTIRAESTPIGQFAITVTL